MTFAMNGRDTAIAGKRCLHAAVPLVVTKNIDSNAAMTTKVVAAEDDCV